MMTSIFPPGSAEQRQQRAAERAERRSIEPRYEGSAELSIEKTVHEQFSDYISSSGVRLGNKIWNVFTQGLKKECVGALCRSAAEKVISAKATADLPTAEQKVVEHGIRIAGSTGAMARAEEALAEKGLTWLFKGREAALASTPSAGALAVGKVLKVAGYAGLVAEGAWDLYRIQQATKLWDMALRESERQTGSSARALNEAIMNNRGTWMDMSRLNTEIAETENTRRAYEHEVRLFSDTTLGPLTRQIAALQATQGHVPTRLLLQLDAVQQKYNTLATSVSQSAEKLTGLMGDFARKNNQLLSAVGQDTVKAEKRESAEVRGILDELNSAQNEAAVLRDRWKAAQNAEATARAETLRTGGQTVTLYHADLATRLERRYREQVDAAEKLGMRLAERAEALEALRPVQLAQQQFARREDERRIARALAAQVGQQAAQMTMPGE
jgi:hypothetical protein